ncbi:MAG: hypothetical protein HYV28_04875 [Ignavibacteriales bacterium]|nr:hypothetical protein [Ignavibacteriales bacterium]
MIPKLKIGDVLMVSQGDYPIGLEVKEFNLGTPIEFDSSFRELDIPMLKDVLEANMSDSKLPINIVLKYYNSRGIQTEALESELRLKCGYIIAYYFNENKAHQVMAFKQIQLEQFSETMEEAKQLALRHDFSLNYEFFTLPKV